MSTGALHRGERIRDFFSGIASRYDLANHLLSGGCDFMWRRVAARQVAAWKPLRVLDLATGSGDLANSIRRACPGALVAGADFCRPMLLVAKEKRQERLLECDALQLPVRDQAFDAVTIAFGLRNMESWPGVLHEVARVLRPDGHLLILDFSIPSGRLRPAYRWYLHHVLPSVAGIVTGERSAYTYLADSIEAFPQGEEMLSLIGAEGFSDRTARSLHGGIVSIYTGRR